MRRIYSSAVAAAIGFAALFPSVSTAQSTSSGQLEASDQGQAVEGVAVLVNDAVISYTDVRNRMRLILLSLGAQPSEESIAIAERQAIEGLIEEKLKLQEFADLTDGRKIEDPQIDQQLNAIAQRNGQTIDAFLNNLRAAGVNTDTLREQVRADVAWTNLIRGRFASQVRVSELRVDSTLERLESSQDQPQYRIAEIFLYAPDTNSQKVAMNRATTLKNQIDQGAPFERVAQQFSAAPSASAGGDLGWLSSGDLRPEIEAAVKQATPPVLLPPIQSESGVYLVALVGKRDPITGKGETVLNMRQVLAQGENARTNLEEIKSNAKSCSALASAASAIDTVSLVDMGDTPVSQLSEPFKSMVEPLKAGDATDIVDAGENKMMLFVCERSQTGNNIPSRESIRDRLFDTEISMLADRYLRDLRREATIIMR